VQCHVPTVAEGITGVHAAEIERTARVLWEHRPVAFYTWSGLEQQSDTTQIIRAINVLHALTGCLDAPGGNVLFTPVPSNPVTGADLLDPAQWAKAIGVGDRPLGPARFGFVTGEDFYTAALEGRPYRARGLVSFGSTPTGRIELYVETFLDVGQPPVPTFTEPALSPRSRPDLADEFPLVLTCAKSLYFCETQHRQVASLRRHMPDPEVELRPDAAGQRGIADGQWVEITTPKGSVRARASFNATLAPDVVCGQHGWFEPCEELDLPGHPAFGPGSANLNLVLSQTPSDPISGSSPLRAQVCEVVPLAGEMMTS
jgi:anaerobic selenocysteine-containing dehydrogenase